MLEGYCDPVKAAEYLGMTKRALEYRTQKGDVPYYKLGRSKRYKYSDLDEWMKGFRVKTNAEVFAEAQKY